MSDREVSPPRRPIERVNPAIRVRTAQERENERIRRIDEDRQYIARLRDIKRDIQALKLFLGTSNLLKFQKQPYQAQLSKLQREYDVASPAMRRRADRSLTPPPPPRQPPPQFQPLVFEEEDSNLEGSGKVKLRAPFCRIGSKSNLADRIIKLFPDGMTTYVEPFVGSGAVLFKKDPHPKEVINDLDTQLINDYKVLKSTKARNFRTDLDTLPKLQKFADKTPTTDADKLKHGIIRRCNTFGSTEKNKIFLSTNPYNKLKNIDDYQTRLKNVVIMNVSYEKVIKQYDSPTTFFYCDPPYELKQGQQKLYKHDNFNQQALRDTLASCKGKWLVSINDSSTIRTIYNGFYYIAFTLKAIRNPKGVGGKARKELFIANYPISKKKLVRTKARALQGGTVAEGLNALAGQTGTLADIFSKILPGPSGASFLQALSGVNDIRNATGKVLGNTVNQYAPGATNIPQVKGLLSFFG